MSAFVAKYNPAGQLLWCTYLGGDHQSMGIGVAAMPAGGVVVAGLTTSDASGPFPTMNAFQGQNNGQSDYFVTVFDANGNLQYSTYLGGSGVEGERHRQSPLPMIATTATMSRWMRTGLVYVTGITPSSGSGGTTKFPVTPNALQSNLAGGRDAFLCIIDPAQSGANSLVYSSFLGGDNDDKGHSVAVNALRQLHHRGRLYQFLELPYHPQRLPQHCPAWRLWITQQRLCDPDRIKPARFPVLPVLHALLHVPGGVLEHGPG